MTTHETRRGQHGRWRPLPRRKVLVKVAPEALAELDRVGLIECVGDYKGHPLYDGQALADFGGQTALEKAKHNGRLLHRDGVGSHWAAFQGHEQGPRTPRH